MVQKVETAARLDQAMALIYREVEVAVRVAMPADVDDMEVVSACSSVMAQMLIKQASGGSTNPNTFLAIMGGLGMGMGSIISVLDHRDRKTVRHLVESGIVKGIKIERGH
jgi:hypothetical protein